MCNLDTIDEDEKVKRNADDSVVYDTNLEIQPFPAYWIHAMGNYIQL